jgi:uncharacterized protein YjiS (DUF1127 family)
MAITESPTRHRPAIPSLFNGKLAQRIAGVSDILAKWKHRRRYRADLARLLCVGCYMIDDIGLTLDEARREIKKPLWRP